ncbi:MAG: hypothetical protein WD824_15760, partial [Cyclobacteriaceae bacterium]
MKTILIATIVLCFCRAFPQKISSPEILHEVDILIDEYKFNQALLLMENAEDSLEVGLLQRKGFCYSKLGNYSNAIIAYEGIRKTDSLNRQALYHLGQLYSLSDQYDQAKICYQNLIDLDSANSFYYKQYAAVAVKGNDLVSGIAYYLQTVRLNHSDIEAYAELAGILLEAEQYHFVDTMLTSLLGRTENAHLRLLLAKANLGEGHYEAVIQNVEQVLIKSDTTPAHARLLGISYFQLEKYKMVIPCMDFLLSKGLKADWIYYYLGVAY